MSYVLTNSDGTLKRYPYSFNQLRRDNPNTSFPQNIGDELAESFGVYRVKPTEQPNIDHTKNISRTAVKKDEGWVEEWTVTPATPEEIAGRIQNKASEIRAIRNQKLNDSDWTQLEDSPLDPDKKLIWALYRETLRILPQKSEFPWNIEWPPEPKQN